MVFEKIHFILLVMLDTYVQATRWTVNNDESGAVAAALIIALSLLSTVAVG